jgi:hypothetical protein
MNIPFNGWQDYAAALQIVLAPVAVGTVILGFQTVATQIRSARMEKRVDVALTLDQRYNEIRSLLVTLKSRELAGDKALSTVDVREYLIRYWYLQATQWDFLCLGLIRKEKYISYLLSVYDRFQGDETITCVNLQGRPEVISFQSGFETVGKIALRNDRQCLAIFTDLSQMSLKNRDERTDDRGSFVAVEKFLNAKIRKFGYQGRVLR